MTSADAFFAADFAGARARFLAAAAAGGARIETLPHPLRGPDGGPPQRPGGGQP